ncbi:JASON [Hibiscus trionum]|uniref:JASON n=1 Tax=Hibiscus trionum TaxID=183268 RepID=A0A9W7JLK4_HIBTR|nr:JASON [Hibiscus trionum]
MVCGFMNRELGLGTITRSVVRFLDQTVCRAMGCFFQCFGVRNDRSRRPHLLSSFSKSTERAVSRDRLSSLFVDDEKGDSSSNDLESPQIGKDLMDEAKFLKACGTIPETPVEIRKASQKFKQSPPCGDSKTSKFRSWLPNTSIDKLQLDKQSDHPANPNKLFEALERSDSLENTPSSRISNAENTGMPSMYSTEGSEATTADKTVKICIFSTSAYGKNKSVRFECESDASSKSENIAENLEKLEPLGYLSASKYSPNPTPLKLSDEMQTPGTVFPSNLETLANGKTRVRSEYVYSVLNPVGNASLLNAMKEESFSSKDMFDELKESPGGLENAIPKLEVGVEQTSPVKDSEDEGGLSSWLKPKQNAINDPNKKLHVTFSETPHISKTPGDRPIIGLVAAHWKEDESSRILLKWWDGNGIPNSTTKYKEDQKVSWHATPFEERLEKALSDKTLISQRKHVDQPRMCIDEADEGDTSLSQLRPSSHSKSVVSF